jgi:hypothetical protein
MHHKLHFTAAIPIIGAQKSGDMHRAARRL